MDRLVFILALLLAGPAGAQWQESFSDGELNRNPKWTGTMGQWTIVPNSDAGIGARASFSLRLAAPKEEGFAWLSTPIAGDCQREQTWSFWIGRRGQPAAALNVGFFWLYASEPTVGSETVDGYRIRYGDDLPSGDRLVLECVHDGSASPIINSRTYVPEDLTDYGIHVRVTRTAGGLWTLFTSTLPTRAGSGATASSEAGEATVFQGARIDTTHIRFEHGFLSLAALYTGSSAARAGIEFDQLQFSGASDQSDDYALYEGALNKGSKGIDGLRVYPNPLRGGRVYVDAGIQTAARYRLRVWSASGVFMKEAALDHHGGMLRTQMDLSGYSPGTYWMELVTTGMTLEKHSSFVGRIKLVVQ